MFARGPSKETADTTTPLLGKRHLLFIRVIKHPETSVRVQSREKLHYGDGQSYLPEMERILRKETWRYQENSKSSLVLMWTAGKGKKDEASMILKWITTL